MGYSRRYKPSKAATREYAQKMDEIRQFCVANGIEMSASGNSYYFAIDGQKYRVSNHSVEASNANARNWCGEQIRDVYHPGGRESDTIYIHAGKTRIMEIYGDLMEGYSLDGNGNRKENQPLSSEEGISPRTSSHRASTAPRMNARMESPQASAATEIRSK